jgi:hypothetical protein
MNIITKICVISPLWTVAIVWGNANAAVEARAELSPVSVAIFDRMGFMDSAGQLVIAPDFNRVQPFSNGLAVATIGKKSGYVDIDGKWVISRRFSYAGAFGKNGLAVAAEKSGGNYGSPSDYGYIDKAGLYVIQPKFKWAGSFFDSHLAPVLVDGKYGYIDKTGSLKISANFEGAGNFGVDGLAPVKQDGKFGYIDTSGKFAIEPKYQGAGMFSPTGLASVREDGYYGYIGIDGKWKIPPRFKSAGTFSANGLARVELDGYVGIINASGEMVIENKYAYVDGPYENGVYVLKEKNSRVSEYRNAGGVAIGYSSQDEHGGGYLQNGNKKLVWPPCSRTPCGRDPYSPPKSGPVAYIRITDTEQPRRTGSLIFDGEACHSPQYLPPSDALIPVHAGTPVVIAPMFDGKMAESSTWKCKISVSFVPKENQKYELYVQSAFECMADVWALDANANRIPETTVFRGQTVNGFKSWPSKVGRLDATSSASHPLCDFEPLLQ